MSKKDRKSSKGRVSTGRSEMLVYVSIVIRLQGYKVEVEAASTTLLCNIIQKRVKLNLGTCQTETAFQFLFE